jgi:hypothetical protein
MIVYHPLPLYFHFIKLLLTFFLFPAVMADKTSYRTFFRPVFLLPVGNSNQTLVAAPHYRPFFWRSYK